MCALIARKKSGVNSSHYYCLNVDSPNIYIYTVYIYNSWDKTPFLSDEQSRFKKKVNSDRLIINLTATDNPCLNCNNPVKKPEEEITLNVTIETDGEQVDAAQAA